MDALILSALRALRSLFAPGMFGVFARSVLATIGVLIAFVIFASTIFSWLGTHLHHDAIGWIGGVGSFFIAWFLFPGIMPVIVNFFDERIAHIIEMQDYPAAPPARTPDFWPELWHDLRFSGLVILLNILALPFYLFPGINIIIFYMLNGYLLGREFFLMAARRHISIAEATALRRSHGTTLWIAGALLTLLATIPIINLFAPFWGVSVMVHLYHMWAKTPPSAVLPPKN